MQLQQHMLLIVYSMFGLTAPGRRTQRVSSFRVPWCTAQTTSWLTTPSRFEQARKALAIPFSTKDLQNSSFWWCDAAKRTDGQALRP
jgi:hypothetical protein